MSKREKYDEFGNSIGESSENEENDSFEIKEEISSEEEKDINLENPELD